MAVRYKKNHVKVTVGKKTTVKVYENLIRILILYMLPQSFNIDNNNYVLDLV